MTAAILVLGGTILGLIGMIVIREEQHSKQVKDLTSCLIANDAGELRLLRAQPARSAVKRTNDKRTTQPVDPVLGSDY